MQAQSTFFCGAQICKWNQQIMANSGHIESRNPLLKMYALPGSPISSMMAIWIFVVLLFVQSRTIQNQTLTTTQTQFFIPFKAIKHKEQARIPTHPNMYKEAYKTNHAPNIISPHRYAKTNYRERRLKFLLMRERTKCNTQKRKRHRKIRESE